MFANYFAELFINGRGAGTSADRWRCVEPQASPRRGAPTAAVDDGGGARCSVAALGLDDESQLATFCFAPHTKWLGLRSLAAPVVLVEVFDAGRDGGAGADTAGD
eukprot:COSAG01_NODE_2799_length_7053_cov_21.482456_4_plen_105_part_00